VAGDDPEVPRWIWDGFLDLLYPDRPFKNACLHAKRTGDLSKVIARLRESNSKRDIMLADLLAGAKLKRPRGNPRGKDPWVAHAVYLAHDHKLILRALRVFGGWKKKRDESIDDIVINGAIACMREQGYPMRPNEERFKQKVRDTLRRAQRPRKGGAEIDDYVKIGDIANMFFTDYPMRPDETNKVRTKPRRSRQTRKRK